MNPAQNFNAFTAPNFLQTLTAPSGQTTEQNLGFDESISQVGVIKGCTEAARMQHIDKAHHEEVRHALDALIEEAGFQLVGASSINADYGDHPQYGYTYMVCIGQSGVYIHTYPEIGVVSMNIEVCSGEVVKLEEGEQAIDTCFDLVQEYFGGKERTMGPRERIPLDPKS